jgi:hypothetical protein
MLPPWRGPSAATRKTSTEQPALLTLIEAIRTGRDAAARSDPTQARRRSDDLCESADVWSS